MRIGLELDDERLQKALIMVARIGDWIGPMDGERKIER